MGEGVNMTWVGLVGRAGRWDLDQVSFANSTSG